MSQARFLQVAGDRVIDGDGNDVVLCGYNVGGWLNMENFLTGFPGVESQHREALLRVLGRDRYERFFDRFYREFFSDADAAYLASLGCNSIRLPIHYLHLESDDEPFQIRSEGLALIDRTIRDCAEHGIYVILDLHALPGHQNQDWHSDNPTHLAGFWRHRHFQDRVVHLWEVLADRYRDEPWVAGYNIMNEPADPTGGELLGPFYDRAVAAVRAIDPRHMIVLDGNRYSVDFGFLDPAAPYDNTIYSAHDYKTPGFIDGGPYPGVTRGEYVDRDAVERSFLRRTEFMRASGTPIWIGEFGPVFTGDADRDAQRYQLLADQLEIYREHGAGWSLWAYKDIGGQGLATVRPDSPWMQRLRPVLDKKERLGVDHWGTLDTHIRDVVEPVERIFEREYPDFDPFPFGVRFWTNRLVRHILLAEPMLEDFAACFTDISDDETIDALAASFHLSACERRGPLETLVGDAAHAATGQAAGVR